MLFRSKHGNQIDVYFLVFILLSTTVNIGNGNKAASENGTELYLPYNVSAENSYSGGFRQSNYQPRPKYSRKLKKSKRQLVTIEGSGFDIALQAPDLNQTQVEFEFPDNKRNFTVEITEISHRSISNEDNKPPKYYSSPKRRTKVSRQLLPLDSQSVTTSKPRPVYNKLKPRLKPVTFNIDIPSTASKSNVEVRGDSLRANTVKQPKISSSIRSINEIVERPKVKRPKPKVVIDDPVLNQVTRSPTRFKSTTSTTETTQPAFEATRRPYYISRSPALIFYDDERDIHMDDLKSYLAGYSHFGSKESMTAPPSLYGDDEVEEKRYVEAPKDILRETQISQSPSTDVTERQMSIALSGFLPNYQPNPTPPQPTEDEEDSQRMTTVSTVEKRKRTLEENREPLEPLESEEDLNDSITKESSGPTRSQNYYTHAQIVPLTKTPESIENEKRTAREKESEENSKKYQEDNQDLIIISPNVRYAPKRNAPPPKSTGHDRRYEDSYSPRENKYDSPSRKYSPPGGKERNDGTVSVQMDHLYQQGHPGVLPAPKDAPKQRPYTQRPFRVTADEDFRNPYPHDPLADEPPLRFDPESDRFYGEPVPDGKVGLPSRQIPVDRDSRRVQNDPERDDHDQPRERKRDEYDDRRGRGHRDNYYDIPVTAYPLTAEERRHEPETDPKGYIQDYVSLDNNFETLPRVRETDFGPLLPRLSDDEFRQYPEQDLYRNSQPARSSTQSRPRPRDNYDYDDRIDDRSEEYDKDRNRDRDRYSTVREPADTKDNDHYSEDENTRSLPEGFSDGYASAGRGFGFDRRNAPSENLPLDPIYTRTLKQFDDEIADLQRNEGRNRDYPPAPTVTRHREDPPPPPPPAVEPYRPRNEDRGPPPPRYNHQLPTPVKEESNEEQYPPPSKEKAKEEPQEEEEEEEEEEPHEETESEPENRNENEKKQEESRQRDTLQDGKDKRPPPEKPQTEKTGSIDEDISGIEQEWGSRG